MAELYSYEFGVFLSLSLTKTTLSAQRTFETAVVFVYGTDNTTFTAMPEPTLTDGVWTSEQPITYEYGTTYYVKASVEGVESDTASIIMQPDMSITADVKRSVKGLLSIVADVKRSVSTGIMLSITADVKRSVSIDIQYEMLLKVNALEASVASLTSTVNSFLSIYTPTDLIPLTELVTKVGKVLATKPNRLQLRNMVDELKGDFNTGNSTLFDELNNRQIPLEEKISTILAEVGKIPLDTLKKADYTAPDNTTIQSVKAKVDTLNNAEKVDLSGVNSKLDTITSKVAEIPLKTLLSDDTRLNNLAEISTRASQESIKEVNLAPIEDRLGRIEQKVDDAMAISMMGGE